jgi:hypothetical protein
MHNNHVRLALITGFIGFGLACGGGTTETTGVSPAPAPTGDQVAAPAAPAAVGSSRFSEWSDKDIEARLKAAGWTVEECYSSREDGEEYNDCDASKGQMAAAVELSKYKSEEDARWTVEDEPAAVRDGKVALEVTVYDGEAATKVLSGVAPKGQKIAGIDSAAVESALKGLGYEIDESSRSREDGMVYQEVMGTRGDSYAIVDWSYNENGNGGQEIRIDEGGTAVVTQGYEDVVSIVIMDADKAKALLAELTK